MNLSLIILEGPLKLQVKVAFKELEIATTVKLLPASIDALQIMFVSKVILKAFLLIC